MVKKVGWLKQGERTLTKTPSGLRSVDLVRIYSRGAAACNSLGREPQDRVENAS